MSRYIDADKLRKDEIARCHCVPCVGSNDNNYKDLDEVLNDAPTADVVEVVRCRDCIHNRDNGGDCDCTIILNEHNSTEYRCVGLEYCSYGERKEECGG
jgi:hypothetical protein